MPEPGPSLPSVTEPYRQVHDTDSRLLAVEAGLRDVQNSVQIWSNITQDGLADLSVKVNVVSQDRFVKQQRNFESETMDDSKILSRLYEVEQQLRALQVDSEETLPLMEYICRLEQKLQEFQENVRAMPTNHWANHLKSQDNREKLQEYSKMIVDSGSVPNISGNVSSSIGNSLPLSRQASRSAAVRDFPRSKSSDSMILSNQQVRLPHLARDRVQQLLTQQATLPQIKTWPLSHPQQEKDCGGRSMSPVPTGQTPRYDIQQQSWCADHVTSSGRTELYRVNREGAAPVSPKGYSCLIREIDGSHARTAFSLPLGAPTCSSSIQHSASAATLPHCLHRRRPIAKSSLACH